jgi:hypothetical protein
MKVATKCYKLLIKVVAKEPHPIDFVEEKDRIYMVKRTGEPKKTHKLRKLRGIANVKMTTDEIMALTRGGK